MKYKTILESTKQWYSDYNSLEKNNKFKTFMESLKSDSNSTLIESITSGFDVINKNQSLDSVMKRANVLCEYIDEYEPDTRINSLADYDANVVGKSRGVTSEESDENKYKSALEMSPSIQNKFLALMKPDVIKVASYYKDEDIREEIVPFLLLWTLKQAKRYIEEYGSNVFTDDMKSIKPEFKKTLLVDPDPDPARKNGKPFMYLMAAKFANRVRSFSGDYAPLEKSEERYDDAFADKLIKSFYDELDDVLEWANGRTDLPTLSPEHIFILKSRAKGLQFDEIAKKLPGVNSYTDKKSGITRIHPATAKRINQKVLTIYKAHPKWKSRISDIKNVLSKEL